MLRNSESEIEVFDEIKELNCDNKRAPRIEDSELYEQALGYVIRNKKVSINQVRKLFNVGYKRAKNIVEQLEKNNIVESYSGDGNSRQLKVPNGKRELLENQKEVKSSFHYVNHILKIPSDVPVIEEDVL